MTSQTQTEQVEFSTNAPFDARQNTDVRAKLYLMRGSARLCAPAEISMVASYVQRLAVAWYAKILADNPYMAELRPQYLWEEWLDSQPPAHLPRFQSMARHARNCFIASIRAERLSRKRSTRRKTKSQDTAEKNKRPRHD